MLVEPSFNSEWMMEVLEPVRGNAVVRIVTADNPVWSGGVPVVRSTVIEEGVITEELATIMKRAWVLALRTTCYGEPPSTPTVRVDGTTFQFVSFVEGEGNLAGQTWSPPEGSLVGKLVDEGMMLRDLARRPSPYGNVKLTQHVRELLKTFSKEQ
jgi:hypothetical protein